MGYRDARDANQVSGLYTRILRSYREGSLGRHTLDDIPAFLEQLRQDRAKGADRGPKKRDILANLPIDEEGEAHS